MALVLIAMVSALIMAAVAYVTRAPLRRTVAALAGAVFMVPLIILYDAVAAERGWWYYPSVPPGSAPLAWYFAADFWYGAALSLVGWRVLRRFGAWGLVAYLVLFALLGVSRDYLLSETIGLIMLGDGPGPVPADFSAYLWGGAVLQLVMYWIAGPAKSDRLRGTLD